MLNASNGIKGAAMWKTKDWLRASVSAAAVFGVTLVGFYPARATADDPAPVASVIKTPTLTIDGVSITASSMKDAGTLRITDSNIFARPGSLPTIELRVSNKTGSERNIELTGSIFTSRIPNLMSRVPMPAEKPTSAWTQDMTFDLKPGEVKLIQISPDVKLAAMSSAALILQAGSQKIVALMISTAPNLSLARISPATRPAGEIAVLGPKALR
jgi:hypothetical protein